MIMPYAVHAPQASLLPGLPFECIVKFLLRRYVVVTRPVRQGRLKLALEEVLSIHMDTPTFTCASTFPSWHCTLCMSQHRLH